MDSIKKLSDKEYINNIDSNNINEISAEIRQFLIQNIMQTGGHLASNLGIVELTLAIHKVFDFPNDKIIFDVGHQCYVHKMITGRYDRFNTLRKKGGLSGFPKSEESVYDTFNTGHSSTSISAALGIARARDIRGDDYNVIALIGDGAMGGGMAFEALNDAGVSDSKIIIILNDNEMSISENVGGLSSHLSMLRLSRKYLYAKSLVHRFLDRAGSIGRYITKTVRKLKKPLKFAALRVPVFEELGFKYIGLIDAYNFDALVEALEAAKSSDKSVIIHTVTKKGKGYADAENNPCEYHGVASKILENSNTESFTSIFGEYMVNKAKDNEKLVSITAAMSSGCGLDGFACAYPNRFFDVGIAEQHAVTMAGGLAKGGMIPVFSVYSTFLQRAYDQIIHDICIQNLHVVFAIDRAGVVGSDGETHQGTFDFSYLLHMPNMTVLAPSCTEDFKAMLDYAIDKLDGPVAVRFPKSYAPSRACANFRFNVPEIVNSSGDDIVIVSIGRMLELANKVYDTLNEHGYDKITIINLGTVKPFNVEAIEKYFDNAKLIVTLEDNIICGGAGEYIIHSIDRKYKSKIITFGFKDEFIKQGTQDEQFEMYDLTYDKIADMIEKEMKSNE